MITRLDANELEALEKTSAIKDLEQLQSVKAVEDEISKKYYKTQHDTIKYFEELQIRNEAISTKLDSILGMYTKIESTLKDKMVEMLDVKQTMEIISQRQENLEVVQRNIQKLDEGKPKMNLELQRKIDTM
jgi:ACT domain-containing protein